MSYVWVLFGELWWLQPCAKLSQSIAWVVPGHHPLRTHVWCQCWSGREPANISSALAQAPEWVLGGPGWCHVHPVPQGTKRTAGVACLMIPFAVSLETLGLGKSFVSGLPSQKEQPPCVGHGWLKVFSVRSPRNFTYKTLFLILFSCVSVANWDKDRQSISFYFIEWLQMSLHVWVPPEAIAAGFWKSSAIHGLLFWVSLLYILTQIFIPVSDLHSHTSKAQSCPIEDTLFWYILVPALFLMAIWKFRQCHFWTYVRGFREPWCFIKFDSFIPCLRPVLSRSVLQSTSPFSPS